MRIVYENKYIELDNSEQAEKKKLDVRVTVGGFGVEKESVIEMMADLTDKLLEMALQEEDTGQVDAASEMQLDSLHDKYEGNTVTERKRWFK